MGVDSKAYGMNPEVTRELWDMLIALGLFLWVIALPVGLAGAVVALFQGIMKGE